MGGCPLSDPCATTLTLEYAKVLHPRLGWLEYGTGSVLSQAEEVVEHLSVAVYPNPFTERIQLNTNEAIENLVVYDIQGRQLLEANTVQDLVLSSLSAGNYILQVTFQNQRRVQKLITKN